MIDSAKVLVTGGAGYIGSHMVLALMDAGYSPLVLDDFSTGHQQLVPPDVPVIRGDVGDRDVTDRLFALHDIEAVVHFAASIVVSESVANPMKYYLNNTLTTARLIAACIDAGVGRLIFSSTAAVYGNQEKTLLDEDVACYPKSPYGKSKLMSEQILHDASQAHDLSYIILRYFNVAGADPAGRAGQLSKPATHLIKVAVELATGQREAMQVFGTDYPTDDGTCIRDYIHISDLIAAHLAALDHLLKGGEPLTLNCGYGSGSSVHQVLEAVERISGTKLNVEMAPRRAGDAATLVSDATRLRNQLGWQPAHDNLDSIVRSALAWERRQLS